ncbi:MAG: hypothetical protein ACC742_10665 [Thermoanaerobaculales bacterium]
MNRSRARTVVVMLLVAVSPLLVGNPAVAEGTTRVVLLGTGNPNPDPERSGCSVAIVISGDARPSANVVKYAAGADVLIHEVYSKAKHDLKPPGWKRYHAAHHTSALEFGEIAAKTKPKLVVLYHILAWGASEQDLFDEIAEVYDGKVIVGRDLQVID